jgi:hypothetical protein
LKFPTCKPICICIYTSTAVLFAKATRRVRQPRSVQFLGQPTEWVERARYFGVTLDTRLTWSAHVNQARKKTEQRFGALGPSLPEEATCLSETVYCSTRSSSVLWWTTHVRHGGPLPAVVPKSCKSYSPSVFALRLTHLGTLIAG